MKGGPFNTSSSPETLSSWLETKLGDPVELQQRGFNKLKSPGPPPDNA